MVIKSSVPPSQVEWVDIPRKLSIAFSNAIYLEIIWRVSYSTIDYLHLNKSLCKMSDINSWTFLDVFWCHHPHRSAALKKLKKWPNWMSLTFMDILLSQVQFYCDMIVSILSLPVLGSFGGTFWAKSGQNWFFLISQKNGSLVSAENPKIIFRYVTFQNAISSF